MAPIVADGILYSESGPTIDKPLARLGLSCSRGMHDGDTDRIERAPNVMSFPSASDIARRSQLDRHYLQVHDAAQIFRLMQETAVKHCDSMRPR